MNNKIIPHKEFLKSKDSEVDRISNWLNKTESPADATANFIFGLIINLNESYYTKLGFLTDILQNYRELRNQMIAEKEKENEEK